MLWEFQPVGNPWWNMNVQQLQPTFTQAQFSRNQSEKPQTDSQEKNSNQSAQLNTETGIKVLTKSTKEAAPVMVKGWNQSNQTLVEEEQRPVMDICIDDAFIGGSCLRLEADVVHSKFPKYR